MPNVENLIPTNKRSKEEAREIGRKGGIASGRKRRERRQMREELDMLMSMPLNDTGKPANIEKLRAFEQIEGKNIDVQTAVLVTTVQKYIKTGDPRLLRLILDILGEGQPGAAAEAGGALREIIEAVKNV